MPVMRPFHPCRGYFRGSPPGPESVRRAGGVKIIDMFALHAVLAVQSRGAQMLECTVEFGFNRGVNELDMGEGASALQSRATTLKWRPLAARSHAVSGCGRSNAAPTGARTRCSVLGSYLHRSRYERRLHPR